MELPPIVGSRRLNLDTVINPAMLSPTSRSPIGRSPSYSPGEFKQTMGGGFMGMLQGGLLKNSSSSNLLNTVVKAARKE